MPKPRVFVTRLIPKKGLYLVQEHCLAEVWGAELPPSREELLARMPGVEGLLCLLTDRVDAEVMDAAGGGLRVISNHAVGFDNVEVEAATRRGIPVGNTPGILTESTADFAFLLMMAAGRRLGPVDIDRADLGMRVRRAQHMAIHHAREAHVVDIAAAAPKQPRILDPRHRLTQREFAHASPPRLSTRRVSGTG